MTAQTESYAPSNPEAAAIMERLARRAQGGVSLDEARRLVFQAFALGYGEGAGDYFAADVATEEPERTLTLPELVAAAQSAHTNSADALAAGILADVEEYRRMGREAIAQAFGDDDHAACLPEQCVEVAAALTEAGECS